MKINGRRAASDTLIMMSTDTGAIDTPVGEIGIRFNNTAQDAINYDPATKSFVFDGFANSIGTAGDSILDVNGQPKHKFMFVVYALGMHPSSVRIIHYTISDI